MDDIKSYLSKTAYAHNIDKMLFAPRELKQILSAYAEGVLSKGWKDYAIASDKNKSIFAVVEYLQVQGSMPLYSFTKEKSRGKNSKTFFFRLFHREAQIFRSESFLETLDAFRKLDSKSHKEKNLQRHLCVLD